MPPILSRRRASYLTPPFAGGRHPLERLLGQGDDEDDDLLLRRPSLADLGIADRVAMDEAPPPLRRDGLPNWDAGEIEMLPEPSRDFTPRPTLSAPPPMILGREGRPTGTVVTEGDDADRMMVRRRALEAYQPQRESKKHLALRAGLNLLRGGLLGEGGVADTLIGPAGIFDRRGLDEAWKQRELAQADEQLGRLRTDRRAGLQDRLLESQVAENEAQAQRALREPADKDIEVGGRLLRRNASGGYDVVFDSPTKPATAQRPILRSVVSPDGSTRTLKSTDNGATWVDIPELQGAPKPEEDVAGHNSRVDQAIAAKKAELARMGPSPPTQIDDTNQWGEVIGKKVNPAYAEWAARYRALSDDIVQLGTQKKSPKRVASSGGKYAGRRMSRAKLPDAARTLNMSEAEAEAYIKREGGVIY